MSERCPPCKIILDDPGALAASARYFALIASENDEAPVELVAAAAYLADIATIVGEVLIRAIDKGVLNAADIDEAHAMSELSCHRAAALLAMGDEVMEPSKIMQWAEELRLHTTMLVGGEYSGAWEVDGVNGIRKK